MTSTDMHSDPYPHYARMRATAPVFFNPEREVWEIYGYRDIQTVLGDPATFSSDFHGAEVRSKLQTMVTMDPPRHTQFRKLISRAFTTKVVAAMEPRIRTIAKDLVARVAGTGRMDFMTDFAMPLPVTVIAELLDMPLANRDKFKHWADSAVTGAAMAMQGRSPEPHLLEAVDQLTQYLITLAVERRQQPGDDLISGLATAVVDGEHLTIEEIGSTCRLLLIAGYETTTNLLGNAMHLLLEHPDSMTRLRAEPELLPSAIEEVLRYSAPFQFFARIATRDVELGGQMIRSGQKIMIFNGSGNRDAAAFPDPDRFDITRSPNRHLSFGHGIHLCLGAGLGRLEARVAIETLLQRFPDIRLDEERAIEPLASKVLFGLRSLPIRFTPAIERQ